MYTNPAAASWKCKSLTDSRVLPFHQTLPDYNQTLLTPLPAIAKELGLKAVYVKDESNRFGLPAFKILGASWAVYRAVAETAGLALAESSDHPSFELVKATAKLNGVKLVTTTEGNWGRSVARMAKYLQIPVLVYVPRYMDEATQTKIRGEGAEVIVLQEEYDGALRVASEHSKRTGDLLVLDTSWDGYETIPRWVTEGYSTMLAEVDQKLEADGPGPATLAIASVGVGSWAHSVVAHYKAKSPSASVVTVEPTAAACLNTSLKAGKIVPIGTGDTIMNGMNCGTVSLIAWPYLKDGVDASVVIDDIDAHQAVLDLNAHGVKPGPCGAAPLAALRKLKAEGTLELGEKDVVVLYCTEGARDYPVPGV
jgi:diaminopropionate ammonia-lyase